MLEFSLQAFLTLLVVVDPIGLVPIFIALAGGRSHLEQRYLARKAVLVAGVVILGFAVLGKPVLEYLGITLGALRIAAGILLFKIGDFCSPRARNPRGIRGSPNPARFLGVSSGYPAHCGSWHLGQRADLDQRGA